VTRIVKVRNIFFVLLGVAALVLKRHYTGPLKETVCSYGGNISVSFAVYFIVGISTIGQRFGRLVTAGIALLVVVLFEITNGFGVMTNVYDRFDFVANAVGVGLALAVDIVANRISTRGMNVSEQADSGMGDRTTT
jgi:hypothetical protein